MSDPSALQIKIVEVKTTADFIKYFFLNNR